MFIPQIEKVLYQELTSDPRFNLNYSNSVLKLMLFRQRKLLLDGSLLFSTYQSLFLLTCGLGLTSQSATTFNIPDYRGGYIRGSGTTTFNNGKISNKSTNPNPGTIGGAVSGSVVAYLTNVRNADHSHILTVGDLAVSDIHTHNFSAPSSALSNGGQSGSSDSAIQNIVTVPIATASAAISLNPSTWDFNISNTIPTSLVDTSITTSYNIPLTLPQATGTQYNVYDPLIGSCSSNDLAPSSITVFYTIGF